jgi:short-subunit dehydrogenase
MNMELRPLAIVTGASSGIGYELARLCAEHGYDLRIAADEPEIENAARQFQEMGVEAEGIETDLSTTIGVDELLALTDGRPVEILIANAGHGLGHGFLEQDFDRVRHIIDTNITGTVYLIQNVAQSMRERRQGRILITGSIAGFMPGTYQAVYNGTKAFIDSFALALRAELKDSGITVTCLMPGATETNFFERAEMLDTQVGQSEKDSPESVAKTGFEAMMRGEAEVVTGWKNKIQATIAHITPAGILAERHRKMAEPGSGTKTKRTTKKPRKSA